MTQERFDYIAPVVRIQSYIKSVEQYDEKEHVDVDFSQFRQHWRADKTLVDMQAVQAGLNPEDVDRQTPWLTVPDGEVHRKILLCRSVRYQGFVHWFDIWRRKYKDCFFVGLPDEYSAFRHNCSPYAPDQYPTTIPFRPVRDALETAQLIRGARCCVLNQSSALWLAIGMGQPHLIVEKVNEDSYFPSLPSVRYIAHPSENLTGREVDRL